MNKQVGDREFTDYMNRKVNLRRVAYLGSGQLDIPEEHHTVYGTDEDAHLIDPCLSALSLAFAPSWRPHTFTLTRRIRRHRDSDARRL